MNHRLIILFEYADDICVNGGGNVSIGRISRYCGYIPGQHSDFVGKWCLTRLTFIVQELDSEQSENLSLHQGGDVVQDFSRPAV